MRRIICSAIWFNDGNKEHPHQPRNIESGFVICGRRHHNCFATVVALGVVKRELELIDEVQGFLTNDDTFVNREEAMDIALESDQIINIEKTRGKRLFSEDLY